MARRKPIRLNLTPGTIRGADKHLEGDHQVILRDTGQPGLGLRVTAGSKSYIFQGKLAGQVIRMTIGGIETWNLGDARKEARRLKTIIDSGRDPREVKAEVTAADTAKRQKAQHRQEPAITAWHVYVKARTHRWSARTLLDHERLIDAGGKPKTRGRKKGEGDTTLPGPLYGLLQLPLSKIDSAAVEQWLVEQRHRPGVARSAFVRLRAFLNWCAERPAYRDHVQPGACTASEIKDELPKQGAKNDTLERQHLQSWFEYTRKLQSPVQAAYLQTVLLTGARREELAALRWADVNFKWGSIHIADKVERDAGRTIPLTPYIRSLFLELQGINNTTPNVTRIDGNDDPKPRQPSPWVFFSPRSESGHIAEPRAAHNRVLKAAGIPHVSIHGLRRSFGSLSEWCDIPAGVIPQIQGHKPSATAEKHYRVRPLDLLAKWHSEYEKWILEQAGIEQPTGADATLKVITAA